MESCAHLTNHASPTVLVLVIAMYWVFAAQIAWKVKYADIDRESAGVFMRLGVVFLLCSLCGYATGFLPTEYYYASEMMHWMLVIVMGRMLLSNQAALMAVMISRPPKGADIDRG